MAVSCQLTDFHILSDSLKLGEPLGDLSVLSLPVAWICPHKLFFLENLMEHMYTELWITSCSLHACVLQVDSCNIVMNSTNDNALHYAVFSGVLLFRPSLAEIFASENTLNLCYSLSVTDYVEHPNITGTFLVIT